LWSGLSWGFGYPAVLVLQAWLFRRDSCFAGLAVLQTCLGRYRGRPSNRLALATAGRSRRCQQLIWADQVGDTAQGVILAIV
jgi:hypothetical protein